MDNLTENNSTYDDVPVILKEIAAGAESSLGGVISTAIKSSLAQYIQLLNNNTKNIETAIEKIAKNENKEQEKNEQSTEKNNKEMKKMSKTLDMILKEYKGESDRRKELDEKLEKEYKDKKIKDEEDKNNARIARMAKAGVKILNNIGTAFFKNTTKRLDWLADLETAGYRFADGIDNSLHNMAQVAGMSHDNLANMILTNSKEFTRLNSMGKNQMDRMLNASGNMIGKFGYNAETASNVMMHYMKTIALTGSEEQLRNKNVTREVEHLGKELKKLSLATGKSVEQLIKEREERERNLFSNRMQRDPKMQQFYDTAKNAGLSDAVIQAIVTGVHNDESALFTSTETGRMIFNQLRENLKSGKTDTDSTLATLSSIRNSNTAKAEIGQLMNQDYALTAALSNEPIGAAYNSLFTFGEHKTNDAAAKDVGKGNADEKTVNEYAKLRANVERMKNQHNENLTLSTQTASKALVWLSEAALTATDVLNSKFGTALSVGIAGLGGGIGTSLAMGILGKTAGWLKGAVGAAKGAGAASGVGKALAASSKLGMAGLGVGGGLAIGIGGRELSHKVFGKNTTAARVGGALSGAAGGALAGAAIGSVVPVIGTAIGATIGAIGGMVLGQMKKDEAKSPAENVPEIQQEQNEQMTATLSTLKETLDRIAHNTENTAHSLAVYVEEIKLNGMDRLASIA